MKNKVSASLFHHHDLSIVLHGLATEVPIVPQMAAAALQTRTNLLRISSNHVLAGLTIRGC